MSLRKIEGLYMLPATIFDRYPDEGRYPEWVFCGAFPLKEISTGRRACRFGWRDREEEWKGTIREGENWLDMLSVWTTIKRPDSIERPRLCLGRETPDGYTESGELFSDVEDMLADDWYLERKVEKVPEAA